jgi:undecaprenyl-diphosphatase
VSVLTYVTQSDFRVSGRLLAWIPPRWFRLWMVSSTRLGDGWLWLLAGAVLALGGRHEHRVLAAAAVAMGISNVTLVLLKARVRRPRPCDIEKPRGFAEKPLLHFPSDRYSFPSGHSLNAFAMGTVLALSFPVMAGPVLALAASVAASRVVLGLHFLSDVLAGALVGALIGTSVYVIFLR